MFDQISENIWNMMKDKVQFGFTTSRYCPYKHENLKLLLTKGGVYFFTKEGKSIEEECLYIGVSKESIFSRIKAHRNSLINPERKNELTGKKFLKANLSLDTIFDVWFITLEDLSLDKDNEFFNKALISIEHSLMYHLKPLLFQTNTSKLPKPRKKSAARLKKIFELTLLCDEFLGQTNSEFTIPKLKKEFEASYYEAKLLNDIIKEKVNENEIVLIKKGKPNIYRKRPELRLAAA